MQVILLKDVKTLGKKDDIVSVSDGYARNYLIPKGFALEASKGNLNDIKNKKEAQEFKRKREIEEAQKLADTLNGKMFTIKAKAGEKGRLFGAISNMDVAEELSKQVGVVIDKKKIELKEPIKLVGVYDVDAKIYTGVTAKFRIKVEG